MHFVSLDVKTTKRAELVDLLREHVWVQRGDGPDWLVGGTYLVARRIRMHIEIWDRTSLTGQEAIVGRTKGSGAALGFTDGSDGLGHLAAGLFFVCFNRDSRTQFVPMQQALSSRDTMMEYLEHAGSGHFAIPPGVPAGGYRGDTLFR